MSTKKIRRHRLSLLVALILLPAATLQAQTGTIEGRVLEAESGSALRDIQISVEGTGRGTVSSAEGAFSFAGVPPGSYTVSTDAIGFAPATREVILPPGGTVRLEIVLSREPVEQPVITVLGTRGVVVPLSNVPASITIADHEDIEEDLATTSRVEDVLRRRVPGFNPTNNGVRKIRGRTAQVFVNGVPLNEQLRASSGNDINLVRPEQLEGIEVSRGANSAFGFGSPGGIIALSIPQARSDELTLTTRISESFNPQHVGGSHQAAIYQSASRIVGAFDFHVGGVLAYDGAEFDSDGDLALGFDNSALLVNGKEWIGSFDANLGYDLGEASTVRLRSTFSHVNFTEKFEIDNVEGFPANKNQFDALIEQVRGDDAFRTAYTLNLSYESTLLGSPVRLEGFVGDTEAEFFAPDFDDPSRITRDQMENTVHGFRSSATTPLDALVGEPLGGSAVTYGFDIIRNEHSRRRVFTDTGEDQFHFSPPVALTTYAPYLQLHLSVGDRLEVTGGLRQEFYGGEVESAGPTFSETGEIEGGEVRDFDLPLWNAGLVAHAGENLDAYFTFSQGAEITQLGRAAFDAVSAEQIDLQPSESDQIELGVRGAWRALSFNVAGFHTESDLLSALDCSEPDRPCRPLREPREFHGIEVDGEWRIDQRVTVGSVFSWLEGKRTPEGGEEQDIGSGEVPPLLAAPYVSFSLVPGWRNRLQLDIRGDRDPIGGGEDFGEGDVPGRVRVNLSSHLGLGRGTLTVGVKNLLNEDRPAIVAEANNGFGFLPDEGTRVAVSYEASW